MAMDLCDFPADVLVEILLRLPPSSRRRFRLVCRHWRDLITDRTTEMRSRAKALLWNNHLAVAHVVDDEVGSCRELWRHSGGAAPNWPYGRLQLVGTCNGLLCLCDNGERPGGAVTLVNPATGETLPVPALPLAGLFVGSYSYEKWDRAYSFAYHPTTGRYKVVFVPCRFDRVCELDAVQVLTLGEPSWRDVHLPAPAPAPGGAWHCDLGAGVVSVDGATHWVTKGWTRTSRRVVSFDLEDELVTSTVPLPAPPAGARRDGCHLTEVRGRLGVAMTDGVVRTEVWVLEEGRRRWSHRYSVSPPSYLARPHFVHGEYVLTLAGTTLCGHSRKGTSSGGGAWRLRRPGDEVVQEVTRRDEKTPLAKLPPGGYVDRTFAYVETTEPLNVYAPNKSIISSN